MLKDSYGLTGRRLGIQANSDLSGLPFHTHANWSRGTAGGGGLYPVGVHWVSGPSGPLTPGIHHYDVQRHSVQRLLTGDVTDRVREALGADAPAEALETDQYLLLGVKYWQNTFKYNSFGYHVVCTDVGTLVQTWRVWAAAHGLRTAPVLWFDEPRLNGLLGTVGEEESVFAVVPLRWEGAAAPRTAEVTGPDPAVRHRDVERSRTVVRFPTVLAMHAATVAGATDRPAPGALAPAAARPVPEGGTRVALPAPAFPDTPVRHVLRSRRSSFGRFDAARPVTPGQLSAVLAACAATSLGEETAAGGEAARQVRLYAFVNHVAGTAPGAYVYDPDAGDLSLVVPGPQGRSSSGTTSSPTTTWSRRASPWCRRCGPRPCSTRSGTGGTGWPSVRRARWRRRSTWRRRPCRSAPGWRWASTTCRSSSGSDWRVPPRRRC